MIDEWNEYRSVFLVAPNRMISNMTNFYLIWPVTPNWKVKFWNWLFWIKLGITRLVSTRETRWCQIRCCRTKSSEVMVGKLKVWKIVFDLNIFWPLAPKRLTWDQIWELTSDSPFHYASSAFCGLKLICLSLGVRPAKAMPCTWKICEHCEYFALMTSFNLNTNPRSRR